MGRKAKEIFNQSLIIHIHNPLILPRFLMFDLGRLEQ